MPDWTLGAVRARAMQIEAHCGSERCRRFYVADLEMLIAHFGSGFRLQDIPPQTCEACSAPLKILLAFAGAEDESWDGDEASEDNSRDDRHWD